MRGDAGGASQSTPPRLRCTAGSAVPGRLPMVWRMAGRDPGLLASPPPGAALAGRDCMRSKSMACSSATSAAARASHPASIAASAARRLSSCVWAEGCVGSRAAVCVGGGSGSLRLKAAHTQASTSAMDLARTHTPGRGSPCAPPPAPAASPAAPPPSPPRAPASQPAAPPVPRAAAPPAAHAAARGACAENGRVRVCGRRWDGAGMRAARPPLTRTHAPQPPPHLAISPRIWCSRWRRRRSAPSSSLRCCTLSALAAAALCR